MKTFHTWRYTLRGPRRYGLYVLVYPSRTELRLGLGRRQLAWNRKRP